MSNSSGGRGITALSSLDQLIVGILLLFLAVFVFELLLVVPCGGWENLSTCDAAIAKDGVWSSYFDLDPYWGLMPPWYAAIMNLQDYVFNPFWTLSLFMYLTHRQDTAWFRNATIIVSSMIFTTTLVYFYAEWNHPDVTGLAFTKLILINIWWATGPLLFIFRMHRASMRATEAVQ